jgi:hypothetical protein
MNRDQRIRERAYEIWESEGKPHGRDDDHWRRAEADVEKEAVHAGSPGGGSSREEPHPTEGQPHHTVQPVTSRPLSQGTLDQTRAPETVKKKPRATRRDSPAS